MYTLVIGSDLNTNSQMLGLTQHKGKRKGWGAQGRLVTFRAKHIKSHRTAGADPLKGIGCAHVRLIIFGRDQS